MNASYATVILMEMAELWARAQNRPSNAIGSEADRFNRMAREFPALGQAAKLIQSMAMDFCLGVGDYEAPEREDLTQAAERLKLCLTLAPSTVANGERIAAEEIARGGR